MRVLMLDLDTLRPDHLGCYGYHRDTSPNIDRIAAQGVRFENYYCPDAPCLPSRAALMSGRFGIHSGVVGHGGTAGDMRLEGQARGFRSTFGQQCLPQIFRQAGMRTVSISPFAERHSAWWFNAGFTEMHNTGQGGMESAEAVTPVVLDWIERNADREDWLLHVNYWDPHTPYRAPADFGNPFADQPLPDWLTSVLLAQHRQMVGPHKAREINMFDNRTNPRYPRHPGELADMNDVRRMIDGYDCGIRYMDGHIGRLLEALEAKGVMDDLVIIVTSDHGENLGELGIWGEHATADNVTCRIPMIIRWPGEAKAGHVDQGLHYNLDLAPTLAELLGQKRRDTWDGQSYANALAGKDASRDYLVVSQCAHVCQRGVRFGPWMYVRTWHDGYHMLPEEMLFNVHDDPHEQQDLAHEHPEVCHQALGLYQQWHDEMMATQPSGYTADPMRTVLAEGGPYHTRGALRGYIEHLKATGRQWAINELMRKHESEL